MEQGVSRRTSPLGLSCVVCEACVLQRVAVSNSVGACGFLLSFQKVSLHRGKADKWADLTTVTHVPQRPLPTRRRVRLRRF